MDVKQENVEIMKEQKPIPKPKTYNIKYESTKGENIIMGSTINNVRIK